MMAGKPRKLELVAAPIGLQPGGYLAKAYAGRDKAPMTPHLTLEVARPPGSWRIRLSWPCPEPVRDVAGDPALFPDAAALFAPQQEESPWVTMGAPGMGVDGVLWRADSEHLRAISAEGLGRGIGSSSSRCRAGQPSTLRAGSQQPSGAVRHKIAAG
jgi:hypothetical protein